LVDKKPAAGIKLKNERQLAGLEIGISDAASPDCGAVSRANSYFE
jgi:hypothetical protein